MLTSRGTQSIPIPVDSHENLAYTARGDSPVHEVADARFPPSPAVVRLAGHRAGAACLHISGTVTPTETVEPKHPTTGEFASFPKRPGDVVRTNPGANTLASKPAPDVEPVAAIPPVADPEIVTASDPAAPSIAIPAATDPTLVAALRAYIENRPDDAIKLLQSLERSSQDYALALLPVLVRGTQLNMANAKPEDVAMLVEQLHGIAARLEPKAALKVEKVVFCGRTR